VEFSSCHGCSLCLLSCPVWRQTRDVRLTPHGRAKALQHGATAADLHASIASCTLCGSCEPACPEEIPLVDMILELRRQQPIQVAEVPPGNGISLENALLAGEALRRDRISPTRSNVALRLPPKDCPNFWTH
jgi:Fe-S oxidoreductase